MSTFARTVLACALMLLAAAAAHAQDTPEGIMVLDHGTLATTIDGSRSAGPVTLPLHWDSTFRRSNGRAIVTLRFPRPPGPVGPSGPHALFAQRLGNAYAIDLNGVRLAAYGDLDSHYEWRASKQPVRVSFPTTLLADQNELVVQLRGDYARHAGLSKVLLGPAGLVEPLYGRAYVFRVVVPVAIAMLSFLVAAFCLLLWVQQRDPLYAWACTGEFIWGLVVLDMVWPLVPVHWQVWAVMVITLRVIWVWSLYALLEQVCGTHPRVERRLMKIAVFSGPALLVAGAVIGSPLPFQLWRASVVVLLVATLVRLALVRVGPRRSELTLMLIAILALLLTGLHDTLAERAIGSLYADAEWSKYSGSLLAVAVMWIVSKRFRQARLEAAALPAALATERERILRDMHDGVGASLATAVRQLEKGNAAALDVAATLRESLDHLKLSIDAMNLPAGDVNGLLASLRYRLQPRIESIGLAFEWRVDALPRWSGGTNQSMRDLQFLLLEAISNALQHAQARTLTLSAYENGGQIEIIVRDDGAGIGARRGGGLQSMGSRARAIGATLGIEAAAPGTLVRIALG